MVELKPCPFCGGEAKVSTYQTQSLFSSNDVLFTKVACDECDAAFNSEPDYEVDAIAAWNTRTDNARIQALEAENARLREVLKPLVDATDEYLTTGSDRSGIAAMINAMREAVRDARQALGDSYDAN